VLLGLTSPSPERYFIRIMNQDFHPGGVSGPPEEIHIYCLDGLLPPEVEEGLGAGFIGNWEEGPSSFLFFDEPALDRVMEAIARCEGLRLIESHVFPYEQWQGAPFEAFSVGAFEVVPAWAQGRPPGAGTLRLLLDPGVVFGSGLHATTRGCLKALAWVWERDRPRSVLDIGTGTGILAVASVLLGAENVTAVDLNPLCVRVAAANAALNRVRDRVRVKRLDAFDAAGLGGELAVANIHFDVIRGLLERGSFRSRPWLIFSGLMRSQAREIRHMVSSLNMVVAREWDCEMVWHTIAVRGRARD
jgi:ribosomal protein L11 methyltransferase